MTPRYWLSCILLAAAWTAAPAARAATWYVAPGGSDTNAGSEAAPFATIMRAQTAATGGDTVLLRGGTYVLNNSHITRTDGTYAYVNDFTKANVKYLAYPGETPVFDFANVKPSPALRVTAFFLRTNNLHFKGFHVIGVQVVVTAAQSSNTQSECFRISNGSNNLLELLTMRDGMGIGVYIINNSANNLVLNCDAYNNTGLDNVSTGNVDGFGSHTSASGTGNVFRGCRAWLNSDDGYDLINCRAAATIENCWAFFNGYIGTGLATGRDGNGFKSGGYALNGSTTPNPAPRHVVRFCLAVRNRASGFHANYHTGGIDFISNTAYQNATNFTMTNAASDNRTPVPGYGHNLKNNLSFSPRSAGADLASLDQAQSDVSHNWFNLPVTVGSADFVTVTTNTTALFALVATPRKPDGSLPDLDLLRLANNSDLIDQGAVLAFPYNLAAPDLGCFENTFIPAPANVTATAGSGAVALAWGPIPGTISYTVSRATASGGPFTPVAANLTAAAYDDTGLANGMSYYYVVSAANSFGASADSLVRAALPLAPVAFWLDGFFPGASDPAVTGLVADPDRDGYANLLEYFFGTNPAAADAPGAVTLTVALNGDRVLRFPMAKHLAGIAYVVEQSADLMTWSDSGLAATEESDLGDRLLMRIVLPAAGGRGFWRLSVTETDG